MHYPRSILSRAARLVAWTIVGTLTACDPRPTDDAWAKLDFLAGYLTVERGDETASGAPVLGQSGSLGRGRLAVAVRAKSVSQRAPVIGDRWIRTDGTSQASTFPVRESSAVILAADASFGILDGFKSGDTRVLSVDVLAGIAALPAYPTPEPSPDPSTSLSVSYGARVGVVSETRSLPAVSVSWRSRSVAPLSLATGSLEGLDGGTVSLTMTDLGLRASNLRLTIGKQFGRFGTTVGIGHDTYQATGRLVSEVQIHGNTHTTDDHYARTFSRPNSYAGVSYRFGAVTVAGELGRLGRVGPARANPIFENTVGGYRGGARGYLTLGARLGG